MAKNGKVHPIPYDPFREKAKMARAQEALKKKPELSPDWKDRVPFSGKRKDGLLIGEPVQLRVRHEI